MLRFKGSHRFTVEGSECKKLGAILESPYSKDLFFRILGCVSEGAPDNKGLRLLSPN